MVMIASLAFVLGLVIGAFGVASFEITNMSSNLEEPSFLDALGIINVEYFESLFQQDDTKAKILLAMLKKLAKHYEEKKRL